MSDAEEEASPEPPKETKEPAKSDEFVVPKEFASLVRKPTQINCWEGSRLTEK